MIFLIAILILSASSAAFAAETDNLPPIPPSISPLEQFRKWLNLSEPELAKAIADWPPEKQKVLREKIQVYRELPAAQRERRLGMLELRWYLRPLMSLPPEERTERLKFVPAPIQPMIDNRLRAWDALTPETRRQLLDNEDSRELVMAYFAQIRRGIPQEQILREMDAARREHLVKALENWKRSDPENRERIALQLESFFDMARAEQTKALAGLTAAEQTEIQRTLDVFFQLPANQRRICINSFQKFANMTPEERALFLRNAARWEAMTGQERETWKQIVTKLPPMPPDLETFPPMPPSIRPPEKIAATNSLN